MADLLANLKRLFSKDETLERDTELAANLIQLAKADKDNMDRAQKMVDWKNRDREKILKALRETAKNTFGDDTKDWQFPIVNGVPRTINRLSMVYREAPKREYVRVKKNGEDQVLEDTSKEVQAVTAMYEGLDIDRKYKEFDGWSTLLNTIHVEVVLRDGLIDWDLRLRPGTVVAQDPNDFQKFATIAFAWKPMDPDTLVEADGWIFWSLERHIFIDTGTGLIIPMSSDSGKNPFASIPVVIIRKTDSDDYWGRFGEDIVFAFEQANLQLGSLWENLFLQTYGQPVAINLKIQGPKIKLGPKNPIVVDGLMKDDAEPRLLFPKPDPDIKEVQDVIDWLIKTSGAAYGLPPSAWAQEETRLSGFAKFIDNQELLEGRDDEVDRWQKVEKELFEKSRMVWNALGEGTNVAEDIELRVTFPPVKFVEDPAEEIAAFLLKVKAGVASVVDWFMEKEGLDEKAAIERAKRIAKLDKEINPEPEMPPLPPRPVPGQPAQQPEPEPAGGTS